MTTAIEKIKLRVQAAFGDPEALYLLGSNYLYGIGVDPDIETAHRYLSRAAGKGFSHAADLLEYAYASDGDTLRLSDELKDIYDAVCMLCQAADKGDPAALHMKNMGKLSDDVDDYMFMRGVSQMKQAADQDFAPALLSLGLVYWRGNRITGKEEEGLGMIVRAAEQDHFPAVEALAQISPEKAYPMIVRATQKEDAEADAFELLSSFYMEGIIVEKDESEAVRLLVIAFEKGDDDAAFKLGVIHEHGLCGQNADLDKAMEYYEYGVSKNNTDCMNNLAYIFETSETMADGKERAFKLYQRSAELGNVGAYNNVGTCYKRGIGVEADARKALENYVLAVENGDGYRAYWNIYLYYMDGVCVPRDYEKAVEWLFKGDKDGIPQCSYQLSKHFRNGDGVGRDPELAFFYLRKAADMGWQPAIEEIKENNLDYETHATAVSSKPETAALTNSMSEAVDDVTSTRKSQDRKPARSFSWITVIVVVCISITKLVRQCEPTIPEQTGTGKDAVSVTQCDSSVPEQETETRKDTLPASQRIMPEIISHDNQ